MKCERKRCPSISPNGRACILESPHRGSPHESVGLPDGTFEEWTTKQQYRLNIGPMSPKLLKGSFLDYIERRIKRGR
jgi:hypothetical protein